MCRLSREVSLNPLSKVKDSWQLAMAILGRFHIHSSFEKDRKLMLGSSNCSCRENKSIYHMLPSRRHLKMSAVAVRVKLFCLNPRICLYPGTPLKFPWSSDVTVQTTWSTGSLRGLLESCCITSWPTFLWIIFFSVFVSCVSGITYYVSQNVHFHYYY